MLDLAIQGPEMRKKHRENVLFRDHIVLCYLAIKLSFLKKN